MILFGKIGNQKEGKEIEVSHQHLQAMKMQFREKAS